MNTSTLESVSLLARASNDVRQLHSEVYRKARNQFVGTVGALDGVELVCSYGNESCPGVSDLDMWVVVQDEYYTNLSKEINDIALGLEHGPYLFTHQVFVLPRSLLPDVRTLFIDQIVELSQVLFGDPALLGAIKPVTKEQRAVSQVLMASTLQRTLLNLQNSPQQSMRKALLTIHAFVIQTARFHEFLGNGAYAKQISDWGTQVRSLPPSEEGINDAFVSIVEEWQDVLRDMQNWWEKAGAYAEPTHTGDVPELFIDLAAMVSSDFSPHLDVYIDKDHTQEGSELQKAIAQYRAAVRRAKRTAKDLGLPTFAFFLQGRSGMFPSPFNFAKDTAEYDAHADTYVAARDADAAHGSPAQETLYALVGQDIAKKTILDVGCGAGDDAAYFASLGAKVHGIDASKEMIRHAKTRHPELTDVQVADMNALPFDDASFDIVVSKYALHYNEDLDEVFTEIARVLKSGGRLVCTEAHPLLGFVRKEHRNYSEQSTFPIPVEEVADDICAPTHVFAEYLSPAVLDLFAVISISEGDSARAGTNEEVPYFLALELEKK